MDDLRKNPRKNLPPASPEDLMGLSYVANISRGGAFIKSNLERKVGDSFGITIKLPLKSSPPIKANCVVRWITRYDSSSPWKMGLGVEFKAISEKSREWIDRYIALQDNTRPSRKKKATRVDILIEKEWKTGVSANIGKNGLFIKFSNPLPKGSIVKMRIHLPGQKSPVSCNGRIKWTNQDVPSRMAKIIPPGMGVEITEISDEGQVQIERFIDGTS